MQPPSMPMGSIHVEIKLERLLLIITTTLEDIRTEMNLIIEKVSADSFLSIIQSTLAEFENQGLNVIGIVQEIYKRGAVAGGHSIRCVFNDTSFPQQREQCGQDAPSH